MTVVTTFPWATGSNCDNFPSGGPAAELARRHALAYYLDYDHTEARRTKATAAIATAVALDPDGPQVARNQGYTFLYAQGDYGRAAAQFSALAELRPNDPEIFTALGEVQQFQAKWPEAIASLYRATKLEPGNASYASNLIALLWAGRRWDETEAELRRLNAMPGRGPLGAADLAELSHDVTGSTQEGDAFWAALPPGESDLPEIKTRRIWWKILSGQYPEAIRLARLHPVKEEKLVEDWNMVIGPACALIAQGDPAGARKWVGDYLPTYQTWLQREPDNATVLATIGLCEALLGQKEAALLHARRAVELVPRSTDAMKGNGAFNRLVLVYAWTGEKDLAIDGAARLLRTPYASMTVHMMRHDPFWFPLRGDPRFEALLNDPKNNAALW